MKHQTEPNIPTTTRVDSRLRTVGLLLVALCTVASGMLGWLLLFAAWSGNPWAAAGWAFGITTAVAVTPWVAGINNDPREP